MLTISDGAPLDERPRIAISAYVVISSATVPTAPATAPINAPDNMSLLLRISYVHSKKSIILYHEKRCPSFSPSPKKFTSRHKRLEALLASNLLCLLL